MLNREIKNVQTLVDIKWIHNLLSSDKCLDAEARDWCLEEDSEFARQFGRDMCCTSEAA